MNEEKHKHADEKVEKIVSNASQEKAEEEVKEEKKETQAEEKIEKVETKKQEKTKKDKAVVNAKNLNASLKHTVAICKMIKKKSMEEAISMLEEVKITKRAVPMTGELPHRKGMMSGRYPLKASKMMIKILKSLTANCIANGLDLDKTIITEAIPNTAGKATSSKKGKKIHLTLIAREKSWENQEKKK